MPRILSSKLLVARKDHICNACEWVENVVVDNLIHFEFTYAELRAIVKARRNRWRIVPGQRYLRVVYVADKELFVFRAIPEIDEICRRHEVYEDE